MVRAQRVLGERPLFWAGSSKEDLMDFPESVKDAIGTALSVAQFGGKHPKAKAVEGRRTGRSGNCLGPPWRYLPFRLHGEVRTCDLRTACVPEEVAQG